jgi:hypothetical protein
MAKLPESKPSGAPASNLAHTDFADPGNTQRECSSNVRTIAILDRPVRQSDGSGCECPEYIDDRHRAGLPR